MKFLISIKIIYYNKLIYKYLVIIKVHIISQWADYQYILA